MKKPSIGKPKKNKMQKKMKKTEKKETEKKRIAEAGKECKDKDCHIHGNLKARGKIFEGNVIKKFPKRVVIEFERSKYVKKYERYAKSRTKIHARLSVCMEKEIEIGDYIQVKECRPLSKIIHFVVIKKIKNSKNKEEGQ